MCILAAAVSNNAACLTSYTSAIIRSKTYGALPHTHPVARKRLLLASKLACKDAARRLELIEHDSKDEVSMISSFVWCLRFSRDLRGVAL